MINVERLAKAIVLAGGNIFPEVTDYELAVNPDKYISQAEAAYIDVLDQLIEQLTETDSITETMCRNYMVDWLKAIRGQK